jgi:hypothetical protein
MVILGWGRDAWATEKSLVVLGIIAPQRWREDATNVLGVGAVS